MAFSFVDVLTHGLDDPLSVDAQLTRTGRVRQGVVVVVVKEAVVQTQWLGVVGLLLYG